MTPQAFWTHVDRGAGPDGCWPWLAGTNGQGRGRVWFNGRKQYAYRVAVELTRGSPIATDLLACHSCDNPICVNPTHIFIGTKSDNGADAVRKGLLQPPTFHGADHPAALVSDEVVVAAVSEWRRTGEPQRVVAERFGVSKAALRDWAAGKSRRSAFQGEAS